MSQPLAQGIIHRSENRTKRILHSAGHFRADITLPKEFLSVPLSLEEPEEEEVAHLGALLGGPVEGVPHAAVAGCLGRACHELIVDAFMHKRPRSGRAALAL